MTYPIAFKYVPIGTQMDTVPPYNVMWGLPFYQKISVTHIALLSDKDPDTLPMDPDEECWPIEDPLIILVRQVQQGITMESA